MVTFVLIEYCITQLLEGKMFESDQIGSRISGSDQIWSKGKIIKSDQVYWNQIGSKEWPDLIWYHQRGLIKSNQTNLDMIKSDEVWSDQIESQKCAGIWSDSIWSNSSWQVWSDLIDFLIWLDLIPPPPLECWILFIFVSFIWKFFSTCDFF